MANNLLSKGSVWRKWDLQVQTRLDANYTCLGNNSLSAADLQKLITATGLTETEITAQEKEIDAQKYAKLFIKYVEFFTDISVFGITDHNTGREIDALINEAKNSSREIAILPGVEVSSAQGLHILCIFDPEKKWRDNWAESIDHFLTELGLTNGVFNTQNQPLNSTKTAQEILTITNKKGGLCIFAHIGTDNGLFKFSNTASGGNAHISVYKDKLCQIVQLPRSANLSNGVQNIIEGKDPQYGNKSVTQIKCSDARKLTEIGACFTWIKADQTFDGLKQIIFEPEDRVKIQENSPYEDRKKIYFENLTIDGRINFILPNITIPLNSELITVIGGRGSGKSALLEAFAFLNEEHLKVDQNGKKKIIEFYRDNEVATDPAPSFITKTTLVDKDLNKQEFQKQLAEHENLELPFLYLGQEQLSGLATNDIELTKTICELIGIDIAELSQQAHIFKAREILAQIKNTNQSLGDVFNIYKQIGYNETTDFEKWIASYLKKLGAQQKRLTSKETRTTLEEINKNTQRGLKLKELLEQIDETAKELNTLVVNTSINSLNKRLAGLYPDEKPTITPIDSKKQLVEISQIQRQIKTEMDTLRKDIVGKKAELSKLGIKEDVNTLLQSSQTLQQQINNANKDLENYKNAIIRLSEFIKQRNDILVNVEGGLNELKEQIDVKFAEFKSSRNDSEAQEKELFEKIIQGIEIEGDIVFDEEQFCNDVLGSFVDNRKIKNENDLREEIAGKNTDGTAKHITLISIANWVKQDLSTKLYFNRSGVDGMLEYIFTNWPQFMRVRAIVKLNGKSTEVLSIGQRGTLLLKVFLATATAKQVFIIDQPEDNLDNNFIMHELVPLIRKAKVSRQIIMSTHNANLVVNADAEQIIVARLDNEGDYISGSIENQTINQSIKEILEGGEEAFRNRENKYGMAIIN